MHRLLLPKARAILSQLNQFTTPLEKLYCFSHTISTLTTGSPDTAHEAVTADELLPILVYLVIITDVPNWNGNLTYINRFHFSNISFEEFTYVQFCIPLNSDIIGFIFILYLIIVHLYLILEHGVVHIVLLLL